MRFVHVVSRHDRRVDLPKRKCIAGVAFDVYPHAPFAFEYPRKATARVMPAHDRPVSVIKGIILKDAGESEAMLHYVCASFH